MALNINKGQPQGASSEHNDGKSKLNLGKANNSGQLNPDLKKGESNNATKIKESTRGKGKNLVVLVGIGIVVTGLIGYYLTRSSNENNAKLESVATIENITIQQDMAVTENDNSKDDSLNDSSPSQTADTSASSSPQSNEVASSAGIASKEKGGSKSPDKASDLDKQVIDNSSAASVENMAKKVIQGQYGNGKDRINALGSDYSAIQAKVNEMYRTGLVQ